jgi:hypothetical protein
MAEGANRRSKLWVKIQGRNLFRRILFTRVVRCAPGAYLLFAVPHYVFHVTHLHHFWVAEPVVPTAVLAASVVVAAGLLIVHVVETRRDSHDLRHPVLG